MANETFDDALSDLAAGDAASAASDAAHGAAADATSHPTVAALRAKFGDAIQHHTIMGGDEHVVYIAADRVRDALQWLRDDADQMYDLLADLTAVDYGGGRPIEVIYQLWSIPHRRALRVKATLPLDALEVPTVVEIWRTADWLEREAYDMFGIHFRGHPDLRRILMPENYAEGHPLRKDFPLRGRFSRAEQTRRALAMATEDNYTPQELSVAGTAPTDAAALDLARDAHDEHTTSHPNDPEDWTLGASGSAAGGAPAPEGTGA